MTYLAAIVSALAAILCFLHASGILTLSHLAVWAGLGFVTIFLLLVLPSVPWRATP